MNSTSSTATTASVSSPDRSLTASPTKSRSSVSMNNNSPAAPSHGKSNINSKNMMQHFDNFFYMNLTTYITKIVA